MQCIYILFKEWKKSLWFFRHRDVKVIATTAKVTVLSFISIKVRTQRQINKRVVRGGVGARAGTAGNPVGVAAAVTVTTATHKLSSHGGGLKPNN